MWLRQCQESPGQEGCKAKGGLSRPSGRSRHLTLVIACIMILTVVVAQMVDIQYKWAVRTGIRTREEMPRTAFIGKFNFAVMNLSGAPLPADF